MTDSTLSRRDALKGAAALPILAALPNVPAAAQGTPAPVAIPALVAGNTAFALDLYASLRAATPGNLLVSPYSISVALAMTFAGARGETAAQMAETLALPEDHAAVHAGFAALSGELVARGASGDGDLRIANALWGERTYPFNPVFSAELERLYGAGLELVDFIGAPETAREEINAWVEEQTEDRIQDIVPEGAITPITRLVLANAIWFYGPWLSQFDPERTTDDTFHLLDGGEVTVPLMVQKETFGYARLEGFTIVELPYADSGFAMTVILPDEGQFEAVEGALDAAALDAALAEVAWTDVVVYLPRFSFEFAASVADTLQAMGMTDAFDPDRADFSGMTAEIDLATPDDAPEKLSIGDVLHKAFIAVDENGTEAAAATVVIMVGEGAPADEPPEVRVDRPFLFAIRDMETGTLLFLGRVMDPTA